MVLLPVASNTTLGHARPDECVVIVTDWFLVTSLKTEKQKLWPTKEEATTLPEYFIDFR